VGFSYIVIEDLVVLIGLVCVRITPKHFLSDLSNVVPWL
jgi:hypothetical protein